MHAECFSELYVYRKCETMQILHRYAQHATECVFVCVHESVISTRSTSPRGALQGRVCADEEGPSVTLNYGTEKKWSSKK